MSTLKVVRVMAEGITSSFRYPFFAQGVHPTLPMPPPATIYGHVSSTLGNWLNAESLTFGYSFTHSGEFTDYEHLWFNGTMNPFTRHLLFEPRLTLYLSAEELGPLYRAFRSPYYTVVLGRSQDLMTYTSVEIIELTSAEKCCFEGTLLPPWLAPVVEGSTVTMTMARYINERREPDWDSYAILRGRGRFPVEGAIPTADMPEQVWVDPDFCDYPGQPDLPRGVWFHAFTGEKYRDKVPG